MSISAQQDVREWLKVSYHGPGFPLEKDLYSADLRPDQKRSVLDSIVRREQRRSGSRFKVIKRNKGLGILRQRIREQGANELWAGALSDAQDWERYNLLNCGKHGVEQQNKEGEKRLIVHHSNRRKNCPCCAERYQEGKALEMIKRMEPVMQSNGISERRFVPTLPDFIRDQIKQEDDTRWKREINEMFQEYYGCSMSTRNRRYESGSVGINIQTHWYSSGEPYLLKPHWHVRTYPLKIDGDNKENVDRFITKQDLKELKYEWTRRVKKVAQELNYKGVDRIPDKLNIWHSFLDFENGNKEKSLAQFRFRMRYDMRSPGEDLEKAVKLLVCDENGEIEKVVLACKREGWTYYLIWTFKEYYDELLTRLRLKGINTSYGWLRRFKNNASLLGVDVIEEKDPFQPIEDLNKPVVFKRRYEAKWNHEIKRFQIVKHMKVRDTKDPDNDGFWQEVDPWTIHGEQVWMGARKKYLYKPLDRGG